MNVPSYDLAIFGGGIAGLWLLNCARKAGYSAILFEKNTLGGGQTIASQGIIHGGAKYALTGALAETGHAVADMPSIWQACLDGTGPLDLRTTRLLSPYQYLWSTGQLISRFASFVASKALHSGVRTLEKVNYPAVFQNPAFKGQVYQVEEMVLDIPSLLTALVTPNLEGIYQIKNSQFEYANKGEISACYLTSPTDEKIKIQAQRYIFTAGAGNETLAHVPMQRRPLQMVMVKHDLNLPLYAHCITANPKPRITITTHHSSDEKNIWYLGGQLAESGVGKSAHEQCMATQKELHNLFPWLDFSTAKYATLNIDRAEPHQDNGQLPGTSFVKVEHNAIVAWPTKLALAPQLASEILNLLNFPPLKKGGEGGFAHWPAPPISKPVWETAEWY